MTGRCSHRGLSAQERAEIDSLVRRFSAMPARDRRRVAARFLREAARSCLQEEAAIIHRPPAPMMPSLN